MADNEEESNSRSSAAVIEISSPVGMRETEGDAANTASGEGNGDGSDGGKLTTSTDQGLTHSGSAPDAKEAVGSEEVIEHILGGEIVTSFVQASDNTEGTVTADCATVSGEFLTALGPATTIIYVQPDGSFVESSGLTAEEQQQLLEQLSKQQLVQVTGSEATRIIEQSQPALTPKPPAISAIDVQQVIDHVNKSQVRAHSANPKILQRSVTPQPASYITLETGNVLPAQLTAALQPQQFTIVQNASQQLQSAAKQVALQQIQNGAQSSPQKPAEPIHIQVQAPPKQEIKQRQSAPITILQPQSLPVSQSVVKVSTVGTVSSPQIIHITPVPGQQQYFLQNPGEPPIQLLLQKPAPVVSSISVPIVQKIKTPAASSVPATTAKSPATKPATHPTLILAPSASVSSSTTKVFTPPTKTTTLVTSVLAPTIEKVKTTVKERQKKPQKIQTRSGRVSRPPKHKVKDYKFIKNEDLAESHQSDSDDYSEISVEEEEGEERRKKEEVDGLSLRSKAFKCDVCEKSYIGLAGLNRHYKLNPTHDKNQMSMTIDKEDSKPTEEQPQPEEPKPSPVNEAVTQKVQADSTRLIERRRPGRPKGSGRSSLPTRLGRKPKRGRRGRPPKHQLALTVEQQEQRRRNRLIEFIEQYDDEDLMEIVLPRLAKVMTVWEFVLMKVENGRSSKQHFPSVYSEFEQLHSQVKKMAEEHFSIAPASRPAVNVNNMEILKSLGITDPSTTFELNASQGQQATMRTNQAPKNFRTIENAKMLPPAKRFKMENSCGEQTSPEVNQNGIQKHEDGSVLMREPQVVLTRLENFVSSDAASETRTEEEPMDTRDCPVDSEVAKPVEDQDTELSEVLNSDGNVDITDQVKELEDVLSTGPKCDEIAPNDENCAPPLADSMEEAEVSEETVASPMMLQPDEAQEEPQVFIETAEGLVRQSAEELASKGIVIVNGPDGSTVHIEAPEGVPLETVHALLGIETDRKT